MPGSVSLLRPRPSPVHARSWHAPLPKDQFRLKAGAASHHLERCACAWSGQRRDIPVSAVASFREPLPHTGNSTGAGWPRLTKHGISIMESTLSEASMAADRQPTIHGDSGDSAAIASNRRGQRGDLAIACWSLRTNWQRVCGSFPRALGVSPVDILQVRVQPAGRRAAAASLARATERALTSMR